MEGKERPLRRVNKLVRPPLQHELVGHSTSGFVDGMGIETNQAESSPLDRSLAHETPGHLNFGLRDEFESKPATDSTPTKPKPDNPTPK